MAAAASAISVEVSCDGRLPLVIKDFNPLTQNDILAMMPACDRAIIEDILTGDDIQALMAAFPELVWWQLDKISDRLGGAVPDNSVMHMRLRGDEDVFLPEAGNVRVEGQLVFNKTYIPFRPFFYLMPTDELIKWLAALNSPEADKIRCAVCQLMMNIVSFSISREIISPEAQVGTNAALYYLRHYRAWKYPGYLRLGPVKHSIIKKTQDGACILIDNEIL
jgi:hypothetical protein